jgi:hypothetical protein
MPSYPQQQQQQPLMAPIQPPQNPFDALLGSLPPDIADIFKIVAQNPQMLALLTQMLANAQTIEQRVEIIRQVGGLLRQNQMMQPGPVPPMQPPLTFAPPQIAAPPPLLNAPMLQPLLFQQPNFPQLIPQAQPMPLNLGNMQPLQQQYIPPPQHQQPQYPHQGPPPGGPGRGGMYHQQQAPSYRGRGGSYDRGGGRGRGGDRGGYYGRGR